MCSLSPSLTISLLAFSLFLSSLLFMYFSLSISLSILLHSVISTQWWCVDRERVRERERERESVFLHLPTICPDMECVTHPPAHHSPHHLQNTLATSIHPHTYIHTYIHPHKQSKKIERKTENVATPSVKLKNIDSKLQN